MHFHQWKRREFITLLGGAAAWPRVAWAQQHKGPARLGFLPLGSPSNAYDQLLVEAFRQGLRQAGLVEGRDIVLDVVWTTGDPEQAVIEVLKRGAEVLIPCGSSASVAAKRHASNAPIVFLRVGDPIAMGLADSLPRPGHNATGFSDILADLSGKLVQFASELSQSQEAVDYLWYTAWPDGQNRYQLTERSAQTAGVKLRSRGMADIAELDDAITAMKQRGASVIIVQPSPFTYQQRERIVDSATNNGLATVLAWPVAAREGAVIGYGPDYVHMYRRAPFYVDRVLKGIKPAELPIELPTRIEMLVNLTTAKRLGLEVSLALLIRADELLE
jgi:putative ABC transport system substrate-binding protein